MLQISEAERLRIRIEELEAENALLKCAERRAFAPSAFGLSPQEEQVFGLLMRHTIASHELVYQALYGDYADADAPDPAVTKVIICHMRRKLRPHGVGVDLIWGRGYSLSPETKARVRDMMA